MPQYAKCGAETQLFVGSATQCVQCDPSPSSIHCSERETLEKRLKADAAVFQEAMLVLEKDSMSEQVHTRSEHARMAYEAACKRLSDHVTAHGCGVKPTS